MSTVSIKGLNPAAVLAALYNASKPLGMGILHYDPKPMSEEEAEQLLKTHDYFDYLKGRVMKVHFNPGAFDLDTGLYDRDNGNGAGEHVISTLRAGKK